MAQYAIKQSTTSYPLLFLLVSSTDHVSPVTGLTPTVTISKAGAAFASPSGAVTELASGWYKVAGNATDSGTLGPLILHATGTGADPVDVVYQVIAYDPQDAVHLGLSALPNTAVTTNGSLITSGTGADQVSVSSGKVLLQATQTGVTIPTVTAVTGQLTAAAIATGVWQDATAGDFTVASSIGKGLYTSGVVPGGSGGLFVAGTNAATTVTTAFTSTFTGSLTGSVASVTGAVGSVTGAVGSVTGSVASVTGNVGGNVTGSVGSISGVTFPTNFSVLAIAATTGQVGIDWSNVKAPTTSVNLSGTTISTSQAVASVSGAVGSVTGAVGSVTGNVGGNVVGTVASVVGAVGSVTGNVGGSVASVTAAVSLSAGDSPVVATGTAAAGTSTTITLATALGADSLPNGMAIKITSGTGAKQARVVTGYVNSTKVVTVDRAWVTTPDATSVYAVLYDDAAKVDSSLQVTAGTVGDKTGYSLTQAFPTNFSSLSIDVSGRVDLGKVLGTASAGAAGYVGVDWGHVNAPTTAVALTGTTIATTQQVDVNTIKTQVVTCAAGVTVNANLGTTQPVNFTGTSTSALVKSDMVDVAGSAVSTSTAQLGVNVVNYGGSAGTFASGIPSVNATQVAGNSTAATNLSAQLLAQVGGSVNDASATTTGFAGSAGLSSTDNEYTNQILAFTSGTLAGVARKVSGYVGATKTFTLTPALPSAPANTTTFVILGYAP